MNNDKTKLLSMIGMSRRAGKLEIGFDATVRQMRAKVQRKAFVTSDASARTIKEIKFHGEKYNAPFLILPVTKENLSEILGKPVGVFSITDKGLEKRITELSEIVQNKSDLE